MKIVFVKHSLLILLVLGIGTLSGSSAVTSRQQKIDFILKNQGMDDTLRDIFTNDNMQQLSKIASGGLVINGNYGIRGDTPLILAVQSRNSEAIAFLLKMGAEIDSKSLSGSTALVEALKPTSQTSQEAKYAQEINERITKSSGLPKDLASMVSDYTRRATPEEIAIQLLQAGANPMIIESFDWEGQMVDEGTTALIEASRIGAVQVVKMILSYPKMTKEFINYQDYKEESALSAASRSSSRIFNDDSLTAKNKRAIIKMLKRAGAYR